MGQKFTIRKSTGKQYASNGAKEVARRLKQIADGHLKVESRGAPSKT